MFPVMEIAAAIAQLSFHHAALHASRRKYAASHAILSTLMVDDIARPELRQAQKARTVASAARSAPRTKSQVGLGHDRRSIAAHPQTHLEPSIPAANRRHRPRRT